MKRANKLTGWVAAGALACSALPVYAGTTGQNAPTGQMMPDASGTQHWPMDQLVTLSVREAWRLGGKTEEGFFAIVKELAELSAQKRGITLPDDKDAGAKAGEWIKKEAKSDPDQLLYVVVDKAVQYSARVGTATKQ